jgi:hypothetical protein
MKVIIKNILLAALALLAVVSISLFSQPVSSHPCTAGCPSSDLAPDMVHGMRIMGDNKVYLSHKPFLNTPSEAHNFQAIFEVSFTNSNGENLEKIYLDDQKNRSMNEYSLMPTQAFSKAKLLDGSIKSFTGQLYRGDIEECLRKNSRGTKTCPISLISGNPEIKVSIKKAIYICDFADTGCMPSTPISNLEYILFGDASEQYIAHRITGASDGDFDQILRLEKSLSLTDEQASELAQKNYLKIVSAQERKNLRNEAIGQKTEDKNTSAIEAFFQVNGEGTPVKLEFSKDSEYFMETDPNIL